MTRKCCISPCNIDALSPTLSPFALPPFALTRAHQIALKLNFLPPPRHHRQKLHAAPIASLAFIAAYLLTFLLPLFDLRQLPLVSFSSFYSLQRRRIIQIYVCIVEFYIYHLLFIEKMPNILFYMLMFLYGVNAYIFYNNYKLTKNVQTSEAFIVHSQLWHCIRRTQTRPFKTPTVFLRITSVQLFTVISVVQEELVSKCYKTERALVLRVLITQGLYICIHLPI